MGWKEKTDRAKRLHRTDISDWAADGLYEKATPFIESILSKEEHEYDSFVPFGNNGVEKSPITIPAIVDAKYVSPKHFQDTLETDSIPSVILNVTRGYDAIHPTSSSSSVGETAKEYEWKARRRWNLEELANDEDLRNRALKCGEDDDGHTIRIKLKHFIRYVRNNRDDSPLYIFDTTFDEDRYAKRILKDYRVPTYFNEDLFHLVGERRRPPYRWFLIGPERSGTCVHIDPLATSAWNTLIYGKKRWVLFPPRVPKHIVKGKGLIRNDEDDEAIHYFMNILPRIKIHAGRSEGKGDYKNFACYEFTQHEGETVYIPNGWWHAVLNLTHTVGVTQNFCSQRNFDQVWIKTRSGRKKMAYKWLCKLKTHYPHLHKRALELNERDNYVMKYAAKEETSNGYEIKDERDRHARKKKARRKEKKRNEKEDRGRSHGDINNNIDTVLSSPNTASNTNCTTTTRESKRGRYEARAVSPDYGYA